MSRAGEDIWLVKSSGRVMGPYSTAQVADLLRTREVSVLDEVSAPLRRWMTIQYHDTFQEIVESLRRANLSEKTEATWTPTATSSSAGTSTIGLTQTLTDMGTADLTDKISDSLSGFTSTAKEIVVHDVKEQSLRSGPTSVGRFQTSGAQGPNVQGQVDKASRHLWLVTFLVLAAVAYYVITQRSRIGEVRIPSGNLKPTVVGLVQTGQYTQALKELKAGVKDPLQAGDLGIYYGSLLIQVEGQTVLGRKILQSVLKAQKADAKQAWTGLGIADVLDNQLDSAKENFNKALVIDEAFVPPLVNLSVVALQRGQYAQAKESALRVLKISPTQGEALLVLAQAQLFLFKAKSNLEDLNDVQKRLNAHLQKSWDYRLELGLLSLYFDFLKGEHSFEEHTRQFLDTDPQVTKDHRHSVFVLKSVAAWTSLGRLCEQMSDKTNSSPVTITLQAACYAQEGQWELARKSVETAVGRAPKDPLIQSWFAYILKESGAADQASVVLGRAAELNRRSQVVLPWLLQARFCASSEIWDCARDSWMHVKEAQPDHLAAAVGLATVLAQRGSKAEAAKSVEQALRISPDYIPALQLKQKGEKEGWYASPI